MKKEKVNEYLNEKVRIKLFDEDEFEGYLRKTGEEDFKNNPNLYIPKNYYFLTDNNCNCISCVFRATHIITIKKDFEII